MKTGSPTIPALIHSTLTMLALLLALTSLPARAIGRLAQVTIVNADTGAKLPVYHAKGQYWVAGRPGVRYAITLHNRSSDIVHAQLMVDGIDVATGQTDEFDMQIALRKRQGYYVFQPYARDQIVGWYQPSGTLPPFEFANIAKAHADLTARSVKVGLIQIALFRQQILAPVTPVRPEPPGQRRNQGSNENRPSEQHETTGVTYLPPLLEEVISIRYDSRKNLIANGVIPKQRVHPQVLQDSAQQDHLSFVPDPK